MIELRENAVRIKNGKQSKLNEIFNNQVLQPQYYTQWAICRDSSKEVQAAGFLCSCII